MQTCSLTGAGADNDYIVLNRFDTLVDAYYTERKMERLNVQNLNSFIDTEPEIYWKGKQKYGK